MENLKVNVEFSGGAELLFDNVKKHQLNLPFDSNDVWTVKKLIKYLTENHLKERPELFTDGTSVRPGILVLVNDTDWELVGELDYQIQPNDIILFISTLHGG